MMDAIKEFAIEWMKKKWPEDYAQIIADDVLEFAQDWARKQVVDFTMWNEMHTEEWRETCDETYQDFLEKDDWKKDINEDSESETTPSEQ